MTGPEYLPVSEGSERTPERGSVGPMDALLAELHRARELLEGIAKQAREDNARLAALERVAEAALAFNGPRWVFDDHWRMQPEVQALYRAIQALAALGPAAPPAARSREERYREALEKIIGRSHAWVITEETAAIEAPIHDGYRAIARRALDAPEGSTP